MWYWNEHMASGFFGGGWFMMILWILVIGLIVWGVVSYTRNGTVNVGGGTPSRREPLDIVRERYAKGEITKEEFETIKKNIL